ncbi:MAG: hypothetical protein PHE87_05285 [Victivallaceae bacterium]|nr:hypothetical protein [Victivallaceae bacterium]
MKKILRLSALFVVATIILSGCQSPEFYQERAVNRARTYLLKECRTLTLEQREYVKFNKPLIMSESILGKPSPHNSSTADSHVVHFCITWAIPEQEELYMVYGVSSGTMRMWFPERLIIKNFINPKPLEKTITDGRNYALQTLLMLPRADVNRIRFSNPRVEETRYELNFTPEGKKITPEQLAALKKLSQYSLIWDNIEGPGKTLVIGMGDPHQGSWRPFSSINITPEMLQKLAISEQEVALDPEDKLLEVKEVKIEEPKTEIERLLESLSTQKEGESK